MGDLRSLPAVRRDARVRRMHGPPRSAQLDGTARQGDVGGARGLRATPRAPEMRTYDNPVYAYGRCAELDGAPGHHPVIVVGAGPVGLAAAIDLAQRNVPVVVLDDDETVSVGSRAICYAKRAL